MAPKRWNQEGLTERGQFEKDDSERQEGMWRTPKQARPQTIQVNFEGSPDPSQSAWSIKVKHSRRMCTGGVRSFGELFKGKSVAFHIGIYSFTLTLYS